MKKAISEFSTGKQTSGNVKYKSKTTCTEYDDFMADVSRVSNTIDMKKMKPLFASVCNKYNETKMQEYLIKIYNMIKALCKFCHYTFFIPCENCKMSLMSDKCNDCFLLFTFVSLSDDITYKKRNDDKETILYRAIRYVFRPCDAGEDKNETNNILMMYKTIHEYQNYYPKPNYGLLQECEFFRDARVTSKRMMNDNYLYEQFLKIVIVPETTSETSRMPKLFNKDIIVSKTTSLCNTVNRDTLVSLFPSFCHLILENKHKFINTVCDIMIKIKPPVYILNDKSITTEAKEFIDKKLVVFQYLHNYDLSIVELVSKSVGHKNEQVCVDILNKIRTENIDWPAYLIEARKLIIERLHELYVIEHDKNIKDMDDEEKTITTNKKKTIGFILGYLFLPVNMIVYYNTFIDIMDNNIIMCSMIAQKHNNGTFGYSKFISKIKKETVDKIEHKFDGNSKQQNDYANLILM